MGPIWGHLAAASALLAIVRGVDHTPAEQLVDPLATERRAGATFDAAWPDALQRAVAGSTDEQWRAVLEATRPAWAAGWARAPVAGGGGGAVAALRS